MRIIRFMMWVHASDFSPSPLHPCSEGFFLYLAEVHMHAGLAGLKWPKLPLKEVKGKQTHLVSEVIAALRFSHLMDFNYDACE